MAQQYNGFVSYAFGWLNEQKGNLWGQPVEEEQMDYYNNGCGIAFADSGDCYDQCRVGIEFDVLRTLY